MDKPENAIEKKDDSGVKLATEHVDWLLKMLRPLLIDHFVHGYKHGKNDPSTSFQQDN